MLGAARNILYLLALYKVIRAATPLHFERSVQILNSQIREKDDPGAGHMAFESRLPLSRVMGLLPKWRQDMEKLEGRGLFMDDNLCIKMLDTLTLS